MGKITSQFIRYLRYLCLLGVMALGFMSLVATSGVDEGWDISFTLTESIAVGDLNGDGMADIATANRFVAGAPPHPGHVSVILQNPVSPGTFLTKSDYPTGNNPSSLVFGDLNGDGLEDIAVANSMSNSVSVILQDLNAPGNFMAATNFATGPFPEDVAIGDLDGDSRLDLVVANSGPTSISIFFQDAVNPGYFLSAIGLVAGNSASSVGLEDLDGDGKIDIVATGTGRVWVLFQDPLMSGSFLPAVTYGAGQQPHDVAIGDLNVDGIPDLAVANFGAPDNPLSASISVLLQDSTMRGTFLSPTTYATGRRSISVAIGDLNGDNLADLAVANSSLGNTGSVSVLFQDTQMAGHFLPAVNRPGISYPWSVDIGDLNEDTLPDLALADDGAAVMFQDPTTPGSFFSPVIVGE